MKKIYLVFTHTGSMLSKIVKFYTKKEYSHVSIALDEKLEKMYSFGRLKPYNAFVGGFVHEGIDYGTFKRFSNTKSIIYSVNVSDEQYIKLTNIIEKFEERKEIYSFNTIGLFAVALNKKWKKEKSFYCAEFVKYALENADIVSDLPEIIKPEDFTKLENSEKIYTGYIREYNFFTNNELKCNLQ